MAGNYSNYPSSSGGGGGTLSSVSFSIGALDGLAANPKGASVSSNSVFLQSATSVFPGLINSTSQTFSGVKTFSNGLDAGSNQITSVVDPTTAQMAATKNYVDTQLAAFQPLEAVSLASTINYPGVLVANVLTITATGAISVDGSTPNANDRILLKDQTTGAQNGVYVVTTVGTIGVSPVLTRAGDYNTAAEVNSGASIPVISGVVNRFTVWIQTATVVTINTDALVFTKYGANPQNIPISVGIIDTAAANINGAVIGSSSLYLQSASATNPGLVSSAAQTFAGVKTLSSAPIFSSLTASTNVRLSSTGALSNGSVSLSNEVTGSLSLVSNTTGSLLAGVDGLYSIGSSSLASSNSFRFYSAKFSHDVTVGVFPSAAAKPYVVMSTDGAIASLPGVIFYNGGSNGYQVAADGTSLIFANTGAGVRLGSIFDHGFEYRDSSTGLIYVTASATSFILNRFALGLTGSVSGTASIKADDNSTTYQMTLPAAQGASGTILQNNGVGSTSWVNPANVVNSLVNGAFDYCQVRGTLGSVNFTNVSNFVYGLDQWYGEAGFANAGSVGNVNISQVAGSLNGSKYALKMINTTSGNGGGVAGSSSGNGVVQPLCNFASLPYYGAQASFAIQVKALGNVTQVGLNFLFATTETKPATNNTIGSEVFVTVNSASFTNCVLNGQSIGTVFTTSGIIAARVRTSAFSIGSADGIGNGFILEQAIMNPGTAAAPFSRGYNDPVQELAACQYFLRTIKGGLVGAQVSLTQIQVNAFFPDMRTAPSTFVMASNSGLQITNMIAANFSQSSYACSVNETSVNSARLLLGNFTGVTGSITYSLTSLGGQIPLDARI